MERHPEDLPVPGVLIVRMDAPLWYANALTARNLVRSMVRDATPTPQAVVIDAEGQDTLDLTSSEMLLGLVKELRSSGLTVAFANVHAPVLERARSVGLVEAVGMEHVYGTVDEAVRAVEAGG
jgi:MFS superfamily sulfate permease-like transporter